MDGHFRFNLKPRRSHRHVLHKKSAESTIACHDVFHLRVKHAVDEFPNQTVSKIVERAVVLFKICGREAVSHHHVCLPSPNWFTKFLGKVSRIGVITVRHDIALRLHFSKHSSHHVPLSLFCFTPHHRTMRSSHCQSVVCGVVVIDINGRLRQSDFEIVNHLADGGFFVITRNEHSNFIHDEQKGF